MKKQEAQKQAELFEQIKALADYDNNYYYNDIYHHFTPSEKAKTNTRMGAYMNSIYSLYENPSAYKVEADNDIDKTTYALTIKLSTSLKAKHYQGGTSSYSVNYCYYIDDLCCYLYLYFTKDNNYYYIEELNPEAE